MAAGGGAVAQGVGLLQGDFAGGVHFELAREHLREMQGHLALLVVERAEQEEILHRNCRAALGGLWDMQAHRWATLSEEELADAAASSQWPGHDVVLKATREGGLANMWDLTMLLSAVITNAQEHWRIITGEAEAMGKRLGVQVKQLLVNVRTLDARGAVLLGLLARTSGFERRLRASLAGLQTGREARGEEDFATSFAPISFVRQLVERVVSMGGDVESSSRTAAAEPEPDWCGGARDAMDSFGAEAAEIAEDNCRSLDTSMRDTERRMKHWLASTALDAFHTVWRYQLEAAANLTCAEELVRLLQRASDGFLPGDATPLTAATAAQLPGALLSGLEDAFLPKELGPPADSKNLEDWLNLLETDAQLYATPSFADGEGASTRAGATATAKLLANGRPGQYVPPPPEAAERAGPPGKRLGRRLLGLLRLTLRFQWLSEFVALTASNWFDRLRRRGDGLLRMSGRLEAEQRALHERMRQLPEYRRLAFGEIHEAGHWGKRHSGGGSNPTRVRAVARGLVGVLASRPPGGAVSVLDIGCGWGEWLPALLRRAMATGAIRKDLSYVGLEIAPQPVDHLRELSRTWRYGSWRFEVADAVSDELPRGADVAVVRHVFQHLTAADALALLRNVRRAQPRYVLLSSVPGSLNRDLSDFGGSSAFQAIGEGSMTGFSSYDLRSPPFSLPEPLEAILDNATSDTKGPEEMLLYPTDVLPSEPR